MPINPYQALLYRRTLTAGIAPVPMGTLDGLEPLTNVAPSLVANGVTPALHLHWLNRITRNATDAAHAEAEVQAFLARLDAFLAAGGRLVWTAHNVLPHDSRYPAADTVLRQGLADRAALVHVVAGGTAEAIGDRYTLPPPERVVHVPHPSYRGAYPEGPDRDQARLDPRAHTGRAGLRLRRGDPAVQGPRPRCWKRSTRSVRTGGRVDCSWPATRTRARPWRPPSMPVSPTRTCS